MEPVRTETYRGYTIEIHQDEFPPNPREWDNLGRMLCAHRRYDLGDYLEIAAPGWSKGWDTWFQGWGEIEDAIWKEFDAAAVLPLYMYDHSGITIRTYPFSCRWDSGQIGFVYATRKDVMREFSRKRMSRKLRKKVEGILQAEVKTYDSYVRGDVYGYVIKDPREDNVDSCWGFYGWNDSKDYMMSSYVRPAIDHDIEKRMRQHAEQLKAWMKHKVPLEYRKPFEMSTGILQGV
jgi:hypothetical protein